MNVVSQSQLAVGMIVQPAEDDRSAWTATGSCAKGPGTQNSLRSESIDVRRLNDGISITTKLQAQIVSDDHDDVFLVSPLHHLSDESATQKQK